MIFWVSYLLCNLRPLLVVVLVVPREVPRSILHNLSYNKETHHITSRNVIYLRSPPLPSLAWIFVHALRRAFRGRTFVSLSLPSRLFSRKIRILKSGCCLHPSPSLRHSQNPRSSLWGGRGRGLAHTSSSFSLLSATGSMPVVAAKRGQGKRRFGRPLLQFGIPLLELSAICMRRPRLAPCSEGGTRGIITVVHVCTGGCGQGGRGKQKGRTLDPLASSVPWCHVASTVPIKNAAPYSAPHPRATPVSNCAWPQAPEAQECVMFQLSFKL